MHLRESVYMAPTQNTNQKVKLTKLIVDQVTLPLSGQIFLRDSILNGFALRLTPGAKSFVLEKRIGGKTKRLTLGRYPEITTEQARVEAQKLLGQIATGTNPIVERQRKKLTGTTLAEAFADFVLSRKGLKPRTLYDYNRLMEVAFPDWKAKSLVSISKDMVSKRHTQLGETRGEAYANLAMRFLRALFNFSIALYELDDGEPLVRSNPVVRLTQTRSSAKNANN